jgi:assimilatory nitrate reductase catalytic subunit
VGDACTTRTTCPYCGVGCGVDLRAAGSDFIAVAGTADHPANAGRLCVKGAALHETGGNHGRLLHPEIGGRRVDWDTALDTVARGFGRIVAEHGPDAVAFYLSGQLLTEDYYVANKLMKGFIGSANVDTNSRLCMASAVAAYKRAFGADAVPCCYEDLELCDLLVLAGSNAAWTHPVLYQRIAAAKRARPGMRVLVIDPRRTATCAIADLHLAIRPGTDAHLFAGLLAWLHAHGRTDTTWVRAHTTGLDAALAAAGTADTVMLAATLDVPRADLETFFRWFADTTRTVTLYSQGINQSATGTDKCNAIINCHLATGRVGRPGMGPFSITGQPNAMGGREVGGLANQLAAHMGFDAADVDRVRRFWDAPRMATKPGLMAVDLFDAIDRGRVRAVWIMATNPAVSLPDADRVQRALRRCELVVVSDCVAHTDTTACAHVLLPATTWGEKDGTVTNSERCISRQRAAAPPPGEARHDWQIVCDVAARMGFGSAFAFDSPAAIFREHAALSAFENSGTRAFDIGALAGLDDAGYDALAPVQWPVDAARPRGTARLFESGAFYTPDGRARFVPVNVADSAPARSAVFPFVLNTGRTRDQWHTMTRTARASRLMRHAPHPAVTLHPDDAAELGVSRNDLLEITNTRGRLRLPVETSADVRRGDVFAPMHWSGEFASAARVGALIAPVTDRISGQPQSKFTPVGARRIPVACWMTLASRRELALDGTDFWVHAPLAAGHRYLLAFTRATPEEALQWIRARGRAGGWTEFSDGNRGDYRIACHDDAGVALIAFATCELAALPDAAALEQALGAAADWRVLAGRPPGVADKGRIVCSCFEVGAAEIGRAIAGGAASVRELGQRLRCGTNCGSCVPELRALLAQSDARDPAAGTSVAGAAALRAEGLS